MKTEVFRNTAEETIRCRVKQRRGLALISRSQHPRIFAQIFLV